MYANENLFKHNYFMKCCSNPQTVNYEILHNPKPLEINDELRECIDRLQWYMPGINSIQAESNHYFNSHEFSSLAFAFIMRLLNLDLMHDIHIGNISKDKENFYMSELCVNCQKVMITIANSDKHRVKETLMQSFLRHIRNAIAHGRFKPVGNLVIFWDKTVPKMFQVSSRDNVFQEKTTAIIKLDVDRLIGALRQVQDFVDRNTFEERMIADSNSTYGYNILFPNNETNKRFLKHIDLMISSKEEKYLIIVNHDKTMLSLNALKAKKIGAIPILITNSINLLDRITLRKNGIKVLLKKNYSEFYQNQNLPISEIDYLFEEI